MVAGAQIRLLMSGQGATTSSRNVVNQDIVDAVDVRVVLDAQRGGGIPLGVDIDDQDVKAGCRQGRRDVDGGGGLSHPALLVGDGEDPRLLRLGERAAEELFPAPVLVRELPRDGTRVVDSVQHIGGFT
jgi:hypothetical protein